MDVDRDTYSNLVEPVRYEEDQPLLLSSSTRPTVITIRERLARANFRPRRLCLPSTSAVLLLFWSLLVGAIYMSGKAGANFTAHQLGEYHIFFHGIGVLLTSLVFLFVFILYPFAGFLADVYCGRYKVIVVSLCLLVCGMAFMLLDSIFLLTKYVEYPLQSHHQNAGLFFSTAAVGLLLLITGLAGYEANFIQFGIDQLTEAPNEYLGLFVHWVEWFTMVGATFAQFTVSLIGHCSKSKSIGIYYTILSLPMVYFVLLSLMLAFSFWKRHWFNVEPPRDNPYKMVVAVLNFARKHKYPVGYSAYMDDDDEEPSRLDYAKERYGGPFATEQVEDVKTFLRILVILLALGPVFALEVPSGPIFPIFIHHITEHQTTCSVKEILLDVSFLKSFAIVALFPLYIWLIYSVLRQCTPKTFTRITVGIVILIAGVICMFVLELLAHILHQQYDKKGPRCIFMKLEKKSDQHHLALPWAVNLAPGFLTHAGITLVITTTFEFISAQSPHAMKGLMIGVMFTVRGIFQLLISLAIIPFSLKGIWGTKWMKANPPPVTNCGFGYLLLTTITGLVGLALFLVAIKRYKYRERVG